MPSDKLTTRKVKKKVCGARRKDGGTCQAQPTALGRCRVHGGATPVGLAHPSTKHGFYSQFLPRGLAQCFEASVDDPDKYKLTNEIALADTRVMDLLMNLKAAHDEYESQPDNQKFLDQKQISKIWQEIGEFQEHRRKLVESERKRMIESHSVITGERMAFIMEYIIKIVVETVTDKKEIAIISRKLGAILNQQASNQIS